MYSIRWRIWHEDRAQDLIEYTMLVAALALVAAGLLLSVGGGVTGIWKSGGNQLEAANTAAFGTPPAGGGGGNQNGGGGHHHGGDPHGHRDD